MNAPVPLSALRAPYVTANDVCNVFRAFAQRPASHDDLTTIIFNLAATVQKPCALGDACTKTIVDLMHEVVGQIENDACNQQAEAMWANRRKA